MEMALAWVVVMVAAMMHGMTGLGFGLVSVPILMLFEDPRSVVVTTLMLAVVLNGLVLYQARRHLSFRAAGPLTLGSLLGVPFGSFLLTVVSGGLLKEMVAGLLLLFSLPMLLGYSSTVRHSVPVSLLVGAVSGALQSSTAMGSPPVALFMTSQGVPKDSFRGIQVLRSMAASALSVAALVPAGLLDASTATHALLLLPALLIGFLAGSKLLGRISQRRFKRLTVLLVAGTALVSLVANLL